MPNCHVHPVALPQMPGELFGQEHRTVLTSSAAERNHEVLKTAALVVVHGRVHERHNAGHELVHAFLLIEVLDDGSVAAGKRLEPFFSAGIWKTATIENKAASISR